MTASHDEKSLDEIIVRTTEYVAAPSVVGHEQYFLDYLYRSYERAGLNALRHDGLLEVHGRRPYSAILCAHIDRHGLISVGHGEYVYAAQYVKEIKYGQDNRASQKEIETITRRFEGERVYAYDPKNGRKIGEGVIRACAPCLMNGDALFEVDGLPDTDLGFPAAYARTARLENGLFKGQLDNAISLGVISALFSAGFEGTALFSTEEEIGKSWTHLENWLTQNRVQADNLLVLDTSPFNDEEPIAQGMVIFRNRDMSGTFNGGLVSQLKARAVELKIPFQAKDEALLAAGKTVEQLGSTELGKLIARTDGRWTGATVQIPTMMYHTSNETTSLSAIRNYYSFLHSILLERPLDLSVSVKARVAEKV